MKAGAMDAWCKPVVEAGVTEARWVRSSAVLRFQPPGLLAAAPRAAPASAGS